MSNPTSSAGRGRLAEVLATRGGRAEPEAPFVIEHREALIYMLCQAAEVEHGIMCQYLFAAFSLKQRADEGLTAGELVPRLQDFATIGHLYRSIEQGLAHLADKFGECNLFVGPPQAQATSTDFRWPELGAVTDLASAKRALDTILEQGEGARGHWETAHFGQYVEILEEYRRMLSANAAFEPVRPVMFATVRRGERDDSIPLVGDRVTSLCTDLFNVGYEILLQILERYFAHTEETDAQLGTLANAATTLMSGVLGPLGDLITMLPVGPEHPGCNAGPSFELFYEDDGLLPHRDSAWALLEERVREVVDRRLVADPAIPLRPDARIRYRAGHPDLPDPRDNGPYAVQEHLIVALQRRERMAIPVHWRAGSVRANHPGLPGPVAAGGPEPPAASAHRRRCHSRERHGQSNELLDPSREARLVTKPA
jgi:Ferritin-like